ncbi:aldehyde dehydrogenase family protein [Nocardioides soli]|uniref:NADP-dependent aldehyde dehydrogenase n=1 Tax=Nocardioides soli TaxID=1036020 RepID=A0A7W4VZ83_9ACTN|nr:NADP-dependent aldehyde dehydrogenase [Nocardioides soli]
MTTTSYRPRDGRVAGALADTSAAALAAVVARAAAASDAVAATSPRTRRRWLDALAAALEEHTVELARLADTETALGLDRLTGEVGRMADQLRFYGQVAEEGSWLDVTVDHATPTTPRLVKVNRPLGPVAVFGASNFPFGFGVLGNDTGSALAAGCTVVAKAHPAHVQTCVRLEEIARTALAAAGAPDGTFAMVSGLQAGIDLVRSPAVAAVGFTGSQAGGLALWRAANEREVVIPVYAEMGTVNPVVLAPSGLARLDEIVQGFVGSFTLGAGQFCTKPGLMFAPAGEQVPARVARALADASPAAVMLTEAIADGVASGIRDLVAAGCSVVGRVPGPPTGWAADAAVLSAPLEALAPGSRVLEECFGPVAVVVEYDALDDLGPALAGLQGSLAGAVFTAGDGSVDPAEASLVAQLARKVGRVMVDDWPTGVAFTWAQQHGGPWPSTSNPAATSVGAGALGRFLRPVAYQSVPDPLLPPAVREAVSSDNPWGVPRRIDGRLETA